MQIFLDGRNPLSQKNNKIILYLLPFLYVWRGFRNLSVTPLSERHCNNINSIGMKRKNLLYLMVILLATTLWLPACDNDDNDVWYSYPNALVTVKPVNANSFYMQLDDNTTLKPINLQGSPFGSKEVRALVNYRLRDENPAPYNHAVWVYWIDSILTKPAISVKEMNPDVDYGNAPVEIINDWVTVAEDGYLTVRFRALVGNSGRHHYVNLITGVNPDNPYEVEFLHNANGDSEDRWADGIVAFRLDGLPVTDSETVTLTLRWQSYTGPRSAKFIYKPRATSSAQMRIEDDFQPAIKLE